MQFITAFCFIIASWIPCGLCTTCLHCENATSSTECESSGYLTQCGDTEVCSTEVRRYHTDIRMWKTCKQRKACENQRFQRFFKNWGRRPYACNNDQLTSHCWCCCDNDSCNVNESCEVTSNQCPTPAPHMDHGYVTCTNTNYLGSLCTYQCNETGYEELPYNKRNRLCLGDGKWSDSKPCCSKPCPPFVPLDIIVLVHYNSEDSAAKRNSVFIPMIRNLIHSEDYYQEFAVYYNEKVYKIISPKETVRTGFQTSMNNTANTGAALRYVRENLLHHLHRTNTHSDVIYVGVEKESDDDVREIATDLKKDGVTIYYAFYENDKYNVNMEEARAVASSDDHIFVGKLNLDFFQNVFNKVIAEACNIQCPNAEE